MMMIVCISRASFLFRSWEWKLQEAGIVEVVLSFDNDCDRQRNQSDFQMVCYDRLLLIDVENCASIFLVPWDKTQKLIEKVRNEKLRFWKAQQSALKHC